MVIVVMGGVMKFTLPKKTKMMPDFSEFVFPVDQFNPI